MSTEELAHQLAAVAIALDQVNTEQLALHVAVSNMRGDNSPASTRSKLILSFAAQWQALQQHIAK